MQQNEVSQNEWRQLIDEQKESGLSKVAFCKLKGIKPEKFYYYADTLTKPKHKKVNTASEFVPVEVKKSIVTRKITEPSSIRLILKNGIECVLSDEINSKRIKEVVEALLQC